MIKVVKHKNRKMYSSSVKRYVTLTDVATFAKTSDVEVFDAVSGKDITNVTLARAFVATTKLNSNELLTLLRK